MYINCKKNEKKASRRVQISSHKKGKNDCPLVKQFAKKEKKTDEKKNNLQKGQNGQFFGTAMLHFKELLTR